MKAVILAAGRGTRIRSLTQGSPKCLLRFGDRTILDFQIDGLRQAGIREIALVVGHAAAEIADHVARRHSGGESRIDLVSNPEFASTNNMYSLLQARLWLGDEPFLCLNADILCHSRIFASVREARDDLAVVVDPGYREETTKVQITEGRVTALKKTIPRETADGTFVGVASFSRNGAARLFQHAGLMFSTGNFDLFVNDVLHDLCQRGSVVGVTYCGGSPWAEIDDINDWRFARDHVYPRIARCGWQPQGCPLPTPADREVPGQPSSARRD